MRPLCGRWPGDCTMARKTVRWLGDVHQKEFLKHFEKACQRHNHWTVFSDFVEMAAISISNSVDKDHAESREKAYMDLAGKYNQKELECFGHMFAEIVEGLEAGPDQDFMGELFMSLDLGNEHRGQFFTPYNVSKMMAKMLTSKAGLEHEIKENGFIVVSDPCCGAGGLLIAFANACRECEVNFQTNVLFVAQDVDYTVAYMCYLQMSLLGMPGYVVIDNSLSRPATCYDKRMLIPVPAQNIWYTPLYFLPEWHWRRVFASMDMLLEDTAARCLKTPEIETEEPEIKPESVKLDLTETKTGQLTFF